MSAERVQSYASAFYEAALERWVTTLDGVATEIRVLTPENPPPKK